MTVPMLQRAAKAAASHMGVGRNARPDWLMWFHKSLQVGVYKHASGAKLLALWRQDAGWIHQKALQSQISGCQQVSQRTLRI